jgi:hypothetical protein
MGVPTIVLLLLVSPLGNVGVTNELPVKVPERVVGN